MIWELYLKVLKVGVKNLLVLFGMKMSQNMILELGILNLKKMGKGITLTEKELRSLKYLIDKELEFLDNEN
jgi:hypothetical protein